MIRQERDTDHTEETNSPDTRNSNTVKHGITLEHWFVCTFGLERPAEDEGQEQQENPIYQTEDLVFFSILQEEL